MKPLAALAAFLAVAILADPADAGRSVARSRQVVRGHAAQAQVVCASQQCVVQQQAYVAPQIAAAQFVYPAPQQVFLPQVTAVYAPPQQQVIVQPQKVYAQPQVVVQKQVVAQPQVVVQQQRVYAQPQVLVAPSRSRQVSRSRSVTRGSAAQAVILPY